MRVLALLVLLTLTACGSSEGLALALGVTVLKKSGSEDVRLVAQLDPSSNERTDATYKVTQAIRFTIPHSISAPAHGNTGDAVELSFNTVVCTYSNTVLAGVFEFQSCTSGFTQFDTLDLNIGNALQLAVKPGASSLTTVDVILTGTYL